jgi:hypothetical protein
MKGKIVRLEPSKRSFSEFYNYGKDSAIKSILFSYNGLKWTINIQRWLFVVTGVNALDIALLSVGFQSNRAALMNPVRALRSE